MYIEETVQAQKKDVAVLEILRRQKTIVLIVYLTTQF